ncbi:hypothetical protein D3C78_1475460 [compost metagenome]
MLTTDEKIFEFHRGPSKKGSGIEHLGRNTRRVYDASLLPSGSLPSGIQNSLAPASFPDGDFFIHGTLEQAIQFLKQ